MHPSKLERWAPGTGLLGVALFVVGLVVSWGEPSGDSSDAKIISWVTTNSHQIREFVGCGILALAGISILWFFGCLRATLVRAEGDPGRLSATAFAGGVIAVAFFYMTTATALIVPAEAAFTSKFKLDASSVNAARLFIDLAFPLFAAAMLGMATLIAATTLLAKRTRVLPRWLVWGGWAAVAGGLLFVPLFGVTGILVLLWVVAVSIVLLRRELATAELPQAAPST